MLDASAVVDYLLRSKPGLDIEVWVTSPDSDLHVPALCDVEVCAALRRSLLQGTMTEARTAEVLADYWDLPLARVGHLALMNTILRLRDNFSAYDATYVALTARLDGVLITCDRRLARAVKKRFPDREVVAPEWGFWVSRSGAWAVEQDLAARAPALQAGVVGRVRYSPP